MLREVQHVSVAPAHIGIVPDGNRRHAATIGCSVEEGYAAAANKALEVVGWCLDNQVAHLSAFGVSRENIERRSRPELVALHAALLSFCENVRRLPGVGLHLFGDPEGLPSFAPGHTELPAFAALPLPPGVRLVVHLGVNYSAQAEIAAIVDAVRTRGIDAVADDPQAFGLSAGVPPIDLVIRTGGQQRLSGFLPFHTAYAELWFTATLWPAFARDEFFAALDWYGQQERRFGE